MPPPTDKAHPLDFKLLQFWTPDPSSDASLPDWSPTWSEGWIHSFSASRYASSHVSLCGSRQEIRQRCSSYSPSSSDSWAAAIWAWALFVLDNYARPSTMVAILQLAGCSLPLGHSLLSQSVGRSWPWWTETTRDWSSLLLRPILVPLCASSEPECWRSAGSSMWSTKCTTGKWRAVKPNKLETRCSRQQGRDW